MCVREHLENRQHVCSMCEKLLISLITIKKNTSALLFRFSALKLDENVIPPCCYWLLEEKSLHHDENCVLPARFSPSSPPASRSHTSALTSTVPFRILSGVHRCCRLGSAATPLLLPDLLPTPPPSCSTPLHALSVPCLHLYLLSCSPHVF